MEKCNGDVGRSSHSAVVSEGKKRLECMVVERRFSLGE